MLLRGGRREALLLAALEEFEPVDPLEFEVSGVVVEGSLDPDGEGVSRPERFSVPDISSIMVGSIMVKSSS